MKTIISLFGAYKITWSGFVIKDNTTIIGVDISKVLFGVSENIPDKHRVYFDMYDAKADYKINDGYAIIDKDWIQLGAKKRNTIKKLIEKHFKGEYVVANYRNTLEK